MRFCTFHLPFKLIRLASLVVNISLIAVFLIFTITMSTAATDCNRLFQKNIIDVTCQGVVPNDGFDDSAALQVIFDSLVGGEIVYFPPGTYIVRWVKIPGNIKVTGRTRGQPPGGVAELILGEEIGVAGEIEGLACGDGSPIFEVTSENVSITHLKFQGSADKHFDTGHSLSYDTGGLPCGGGAHHVNSCGKTIGTGSAFRAAIRADGQCGSGGFVDGLKVRRNEFVNLYGAAIAVRDANNIVIAGNRLLDGRAPFAHLTSQSADSETLIPQFEQVLIKNNILFNITDSSSLFANAMVVGIYRDVRIVGNTATNIDRTLVRLSAWDAVVANNTLMRNLNPQYAAIDIHGNSRDIVIKHNEFSDVGRGISLNTVIACQNIRIKNNKISDTRFDGILIASNCKGPRIVINNNKLTEIGASGVPAIIRAGIDVPQAVDGLTVKRNIISGFVVPGDPVTQGSAIRLRHIDAFHGIARNYTFIGNDMSGFAIPNSSRLFDIRGAGFYENLVIIRNRIDAGSPDGRGIWAIGGSVGDPPGSNYILSGRIVNNFINGKAAGDHSNTNLVVKNNEVTGSNTLVGGN